MGVRSAAAPAACSTRRGVLRIRLHRDRASVPKSGLFTADCLGCEDRFVNSHSTEQDDSVCDTQNDEVLLSGFGWSQLRLPQQPRLRAYVVLSAERRSQSLRTGVPANIFCVGGARATRVTSAPAGSPGDRLRSWPQVRRPPWGCVGGVFTPTTVTPVLGAPRLHSPVRRA